MILRAYRFSRREFRNREAEERVKAATAESPASVGANSGIVRRLASISRCRGVNLLQSARIQES